jgi:hypothetical protein
MHSVKTYHTVVLRKSLYTEIKWITIILTFLPLLHFAGGNVLPLDDEVTVWHSD